MPETLNSPIRALALLDAPGAVLRGIPAGNDDRDRPTSLISAEVVTASGKRAAVSEESAAALIDPADPCVELVKRERRDGTTWHVYRVLPDPEDGPELDANAPGIGAARLGARLEELSDLDAPPPHRGGVGGDGQVGRAPEPPAEPYVDRLPEGLPGAAHNAAERGEPWAGVVTVTPRLARLWLLRNTANRPCRRAKVNHHRAQMDAGRWLLGTDAVGFRLDGPLVNGQHRLEAVAAGETAHEFVVAVGLDRDVFAVLDVGKGRTGGDALAVLGFPYSSSVAAVVRYAAFAEAGALWTRASERRIEVDELVDRAEADRDAFVEAAAKATQLYDKSDRLLSPTQVGFVVYAYRQAGHSEAGPVPAPVEAYLQRVATGIGVLDEADPAHHVRRAFLDDQRADVRMGAQERLAVLVRGAQHAALGEPMLRARGKGAGAWPSLVGWPKQDNPALRRKATTDEAE